MVKAHSHAQVEISPAVAMLVVILVLSMTTGLLLYSLEHNSVGIAAPSSTIRGRAVSPLSRGETGTKARTAPGTERSEGSVAAPGR